MFLYLNNCYRKLQLDKYIKKYYNTYYVEIDYSFF